MDAILKNKTLALIALVILGLSFLGTQGGLLAVAAYVASLLIVDLTILISVLNVAYSTIIRFTPIKYRIWQVRLIIATCAVVAVVGAGWLLKRYVVAFHLLAVSQIVKRTRLIDILLTRFEDSIWSGNFHTIVSWM